MSNEPNPDEAIENHGPTSTPLINRAKVKSLALACAQHRARKFTRVGDSFFVAAEACLRNFVNNRVASHPSVGVTLK